MATLQPSSRRRCPCWWTNSSTPNLRGCVTQGPGHPEHRRPSPVHATFRQQCAGTSGPGMGDDVRSSGLEDAARKPAAWSFITSCPSREEGRRLPRISPSVAAVITATNPSWPTSQLPDRPSAARPGRRARAVERPARRSSACQRRKRKGDDLRTGVARSRIRAKRRLIASIGNASASHAPPIHSAIRSCSS